MQIKKLRLKKLMSQAELAEKVGVFQTAISQWGSGACMPRADKLPALAAALGCTVDELFKTGGDDDAED